MSRNEVLKGHIMVIKQNGFGFVKGADNKEYFFNFNDVEEKWDNFYKRFGDRINLQSEKVEVHFTPGNTPKGPRAYEVEVQED